MSSICANGIIVRNAKMTDALRIQELVNAFARDDVMLPRSVSYIYENIRDFKVLEKDGNVVACSALHFYWNDLAEVRSLAVDSLCSGQGFGRVLVEENIKEAAEFGVKRVFCLTLVPGFFSKLGFTEVPHSDLPQKVYKDCINCVKLGNCDEIAMVKDTNS